MAEKRKRFLWVYQEQGKITLGDLISQLQVVVLAP
jgi:hypothetical protein